MHNEEIREYAKKNRIPLWMVADALNVSEATFTRMMRHELPAERKAEIKAVMKGLVNERIGTSERRTPERNKGK